MITKEKEADILVSDMPLPDTRKKGNQTDIFMVLQILSYAAQTDREVIRKRQAEGIAAARIKGYGSAGPANRFHRSSQWFAGREGGKISSREAAARLDISQDACLRWVRDEEGIRNGKRKIW